jgi:hypothetical protein
MVRRGRTLTATQCLVGAAAVAYAAPLALSRYFPGADLPFHALAVAAGDVNLLFVDRQPGGTSYLTLYALARPLYRVLGDPALALQLIGGLAVIGFVAAAARLARSLAVHPGVAVLAAPAAYSVVAAYGFLPFSLAYPLMFWLWAFAREAMATNEWCWQPLAGVAATSLAIAVTHPLAAAIAGVGVVAILAASIDCRNLRRAAAVGGLALLAAVPAVAAAAKLSGHPDPDLPGLLADASLWDRLAAGPRSSLAAALLRGPCDVVGAIAPSWRAVVIVSSLAAGMVARRAAVAERAPGRRGWCAELLLAALVAVYLLTPYYLEAPLVVAV